MLSGIKIGTRIFIDFDRFSVVKLDNYGFTSITKVTFYENVCYLVSDEIFFISL